MHALADPHDSCLNRRILPVSPGTHTHAHARTHTHTHTDLFLQTDAQARTHTHSLGQITMFTTPPHLSLSLFFPPPLPRILTCRPIYFFLTAVFILIFFPGNNTETPTPQFTCFSFSLHSGILPFYISSKIPNRTLPFCFSFFCDYPPT